MFNLFVRAATMFKKCAKNVQFFKHLGPFNRSFLKECLVFLVKALVIPVPMAWIPLKSFANGCEHFGHLHVNVSAGKCQINVRKMSTFSNKAGINVQFLTKMSQKCHKNV